MRDLLGVRIELGDMVIFPEHKTKYSAGVVKKFGRNGTITLEAIYSNNGWRRRIPNTTKRKKDDICIVVSEARLLDIKTREASKLQKNGVIRVTERDWSLNDGTGGWVNYEFTVEEYVLRQTKDTIRLHRIMRNHTLENQDGRYLFQSEEEKEEFQKKYKIIIPTEEVRKESLEETGNLPF